MMPPGGRLPSILRMATHAKASPGILSSFARAVLFNLALAALLERLRRHPSLSTPDGQKVHRGLVRGLGRALLTEGVEMALVDVRWQRRRVAAAIDRAAAAASVRPAPVMAAATPAIPEQRRTGYRNRAASAPPVSIDH